jgi:hypothetical protein
MPRDFHTVLIFSTRFFQQMVKPQKITELLQASAQGEQTALEQVKK